MRRKRAIGGLGLLLVAAAAPATAGTHRRHAAPPPVPASAPHSFYPETVEGGVPGNLPFNNQIRKHSDPLNANGAK